MKKGRGRVVSLFPVPVVSPDEALLPEWCRGIIPHIRLAQMIRIKCLSIANDKRVRGKRRPLQRSLRGSMQVNWIVLQRRVAKEHTLLPRRTLSTRLRRRYSICQNGMKKERLGETHCSKSGCIGFQNPMIEKAKK